MRHIVKSGNISGELQNQKCSDLLFIINNTAVLRLINKKLFPAFSLFSLFKRKCTATRSHVAVIRPEGDNGVCSSGRQFKSTA